MQIERSQCEEDIADLFFAIQLFSYPGDYVAEDPNIEGIAETIDKLEEDVLGVKTATVRGSRTATVKLGEPIPVPSSRSKRLSATELTQLLEARVQGLLNGHSPSWHRAVAKTQDAKSHSSGTIKCRDIFSESCGLTLNLSYSLSAFLVS